MCHDGTQLQRPFPMNPAPAMAAMPALPMAIGNRASDTGPRYAARIFGFERLTYKIKSSVSYAICISLALCDRCQLACPDPEHSFARGFVKKGAQLYIYIYIIININSNANINIDIKRTIYE